MIIINLYMRTTAYFSAFIEFFPWTNKCIKIVFHFHFIPLYYHIISYVSVSIFINIFLSLLKFNRMHQVM